MTDLSLRLGQKYRVRLFPQDEVREMWLHDISPRGLLRFSPTEDDMGPQITIGLYKETLWQDYAVWANPDELILRGVVEGEA